MILLVDYLHQQLNLLPEAKRYLVGFSGGLDSYVLLKLLTQLDIEIPVVAIHINHSIQEQADQWQDHCESIARGLKIEFLGAKVDANPPAGESPEAWARKKRYATFSNLMQQGDILLLAHHQDDQIETFFLQLFRGSGPHGLASMPKITGFSGGWLARPLLELDRQDLEHFAQQNNLQWIEDPSNQDESYDRNHLRHTILPLVRERWPGCANSLSRSISLQSDACVLLDACALEDMDLVCCNEQSNLSVSKLLQLSDTRNRNLLRFWIKEAGFPLPSQQKLRQIIDTVLRAADDRSPCVEWPGVEIRRYQDQLMIMLPQTQQDPAAAYQWDLRQPMQLATGSLRAKKSLVKVLL